MKILVVDDEKNVRRILRDYLQNEGFEVVEAADGIAGVDQATKHKDLDLILLDIRMPKLNGFEAIKEIREVSDTPVMFLSALDESFHEIKGLELGGDDYITKPFNYKVLMARVNTCLRKNDRFQKDIVTYGNFIIDFRKKSASVDAKDCGLALREFELLVFFYKNKGISLERLKILDRVWGYDYEGDPRTVDTHVKTLRAKLGDYGYWIKTVRGVGYRFEIPEY